MRGGGSTVNISTPSGTDLAYNQKDVSAKAGSVTIDFQNNESISHDVAVEDSSGMQVGATDLVSSGSANATVDLHAGDLRVLLHRPRPPPGRHGRNAHRQVNQRAPGYSGNARPTESATQAGLSEPSTSTVKRVTICHQPPPTSSTSVTSAVARIREPAGTGAGKRTLFQP